MDDNRFWLSLFTMVSVCLVGITALLTYSAHLEDDKLMQMVKAGSEPLRVKCALAHAETAKASPVCVALANEK